jgi:hypothetical protein
MAQQSPPVEPAVKTPPTGADRWLPLFVVTLALLVVFLGLVAILMIQADDVSDVTWTRLTYLLGGVEAIVFTAVGWLFGREVHRGEAQAAKEDAATSKEVAAKATDDAKVKSEEAAIERTKGLAIKAAARRTVKARGRSVPAEGGARPTSLGSATAPEDDSLDALAGMVEDLWPD